MKCAERVVPFAEKKSVGPFGDYIYWQCNRCKRSISFGPQGHTVVGEGKKPTCFSAGVCGCPGIMWKQEGEDWLNIAKSRPQVVEFCSFGI